MSQNNKRMKARIRGIIQNLSRQYVDYNELESTEEEIANFIRTVDFDVRTAGYIYGKKIA